MIYTYDKTTGQVVMVSDGKNTYDNPNWADIEADESYFEDWKAKTSSDESLVVDLATEAVSVDKSVKTF